MRLIVLSGLPGSGKSTVAEAVGRSVRATVLSVDPIESAIVRAGIEHGFETGLAAYLVAETIADASLASGLDVVIDAVNSVEEARDMWRALALRRDAELRVVECVLAGEEVGRARLAGRRRGLAVPEPTWADVERRRAEWTPWPEPHLTLDAARPIEEKVDLALAYVAAAPGADGPRDGGRRPADP